MVVSTYESIMKKMVATLPPVLPLGELYTSTRVSPVANTAVTKIITDTAPMAAPVMTSASCSGSSLEKVLVVKCCSYCDSPVKAVRHFEDLLQ